MISISQLARIANTLLCVPRSICSDMKREREIETAINAICKPSKEAIRAFAKTGIVIGGKVKT